MVDALISASDTVNVNGTICRIRSWPKSKRVDTAGRGKLRMTGDLTINAITRQVILQVEGPTAPIKDTQGREKIGVRGTTTISRKSYGILYNPVMETGGASHGVLAGSSGASRVAAA